VDLLLKVNDALLGCMQSILHLDKLALPAEQLFGRARAVKQAGQLLNRRFGLLSQISKSGRFLICARKAFVDGFGTSGWREPVLLLRHPGVPSAATLAVVAVLSDPFARARQANAGFDIFNPHDLIQALR